MSDCSTHAFDVPLKPCPFCGSGWLYETRRNGYCDETPTMFCNSCKAVVTWEQVEEEGVNGETKAFVREHWNSRAERTCEPVSMRTFDSMETALSIAEKEVEIEELRRENYELCKENEELAHRRAELESTAHGTLTAEQVSKATYVHSIHADCADADWQAIADELNSRAERTCRWEYPQGVNGWIGYTVCSSCGEKYDECVTDTAHYCPNCGAKVIGG